MKLRDLWEKFLLPDISKVDDVRKHRLMMVSVSDDIPDQIESFINTKQTLIWD